MTKIDFNWRRAAAVRDLDDLAAILFPGNDNHQRAFAAIFTELRQADHSFLPVLEPVRRKYRITKRTFEKVRAKMRRLGLLEHTTHFNPNGPGWRLSSRMESSLVRMAKAVRYLRRATGRG